MKFDYSAFLSPSPDTGEEVVILRPEVPLRVHGPAGSAIYMALVDTGADNTILPLSIASELGIAVAPAIGPKATAFGGQSIELVFADVELELADEAESIRWFARIYFFGNAKLESETLVVGHQGFLDYFTATFDGEQAMLELRPNRDIPLAAQES